MKRVLRYLIFLIIIVGVLLAFSNLQKLRENFENLRLSYLVMASMCALFLYLMEGFFLYVSLRVYDERIPLVTSIRASLVINALGYFVSLGGLTPFATQIHVLHHYGVSGSKATVTRLLHMFFFNLLFDVLLVSGLVYVLLPSTHTGTGTRLVVLACFLFLGLRPLFYLSLLWRKFREVILRALFGVVNAVLGLFTKNKRLEPLYVLHLFDDFQEGFENLAGKPLHLTLIVLITVIINILWVSIMFFSFRSVRFPVSFGVLAVGFAIGQIVGILSMIPGGIGTLEGSSSLAYAALGVTFETALSAMAVYRLAYNLIPFAVCLPFYFGLKHEME